MRLGNSFAPPPEPSCNYGYTDCNSEQSPRHNLNRLLKLFFLSQCLDEVVASSQNQVCLVISGSMLCLQRRRPSYVMMAVTATPHCLLTWHG